MRICDQKIWNLVSVCRVSAVQCTRLALNRPKSTRCSKGVILMRTSGVDFQVKNTSASGTLSSKLMLNGPSLLGVVIWDRWWVVQAPLPPHPTPLMGLSL